MVKVAWGLVAVLAVALVVVTTILVIGDSPARLTVKRTYVCPDPDQGAGKLSKTCEELVRVRPIQDPRYEESEEQLAALRLICGGVQPVGGPAGYVQFVQCEGGDDDVEVIGNNADRTPAS